MLRQFRQKIIQHLWKNYRQASLPARQIEEKLMQKGITKLILDHFAIIDLPGPYSGIPYLKKLFSTLGYVEQGSDYLAEKQNDFLWMTEAESAHLAALEVLPQVVVADFRLDELPHEVRIIIEKYARLTSMLPQKEIHLLVERLKMGDLAAEATLFTLVMHYLAGRDWPLPTLKEFSTVREFNELLGWVLIFGRKPNHFTLSIHLLNHFENFSDFLKFIVEEVKLELNTQGEIIKGGSNIGIAQASTKEFSETIHLLDSKIEVPTHFVEFVWRYPQHSGEQPPRLWQDYFTGFVAQHANRVIESLYR